MRIYGTYTPTKWDERTIQEIENRMKLTKATVEFTFSGDIEGVGYIEYLMFYSSFDPDDMHNSHAKYVGQLRIVGKLKGKSGSFVLEDAGTFSGGVARSELAIISGSGTDELRAISGVGEYSADQSACAWEMEVSL